MTFVAWSTSRAFRSTHLRLGDLAQLGAREPADLGAVRLGRALLEPQRLLDQDGGRRRLRDEREAAVLVDRDLDRGDAAVLLRRLRVERLAELHDVHAVLAERRADRRRRVGLPAGDLELDQCENFFAICFCLSCSVEFLDLVETELDRNLPLEDVDQHLSFCWSGLTSTISPSKSESGPDVTFTDSPSENSTCARGAVGRRRRRSSGSGRPRPARAAPGLEPAPTKPVTPGVFFTTVQASSLMSMFTST